MVKVVKVNKDGVTVSTEMVSSKAAEAFLKTHRSESSEPQKSSVEAKPVDIQELNRNVVKKLNLGKQLANQRVFFFCYHFI